MARTVIAAPLHNGAAHLAEAVASLLGQTRRDLALILVDDASTDETPRIARAFAESDPRVAYERNPSRLGLIGTWQRGLDLARRRHPEAEFFAWGSDHDAWDARWLEALAGVLERRPEAVLAYPLALRVGPRGEPLRPEPSWRFETAGVADPAQRFLRFARDGVAGDMVYGLFRLAPLAETGFPLALAPDRLLLARLALAGEFHQVPEVLWRRRYVVRVSSSRQRAAFFPDGAPAWSRVPWPLAHFAALREPAGTRLAARYLAASSWRQARKQLLRPVGAASRLRRRMLPPPADSAGRNDPVRSGDGCHPVGRPKP